MPDSKQLDADSGIDDLLDKEELFARCMDRLSAGELLDLEAIERENPVIGPEVVGQLRVFQDFDSLEQEVDLDRTDESLQQIGNYKLLQRIGEGGMGIVYMAQQETPVQRKVALKIIKLGMDTKEVVARFEAERQALAMMDHPNIARVLDAGATDTGRPYFVMELVQGVPITMFCEKNTLPIKQRLELFVDVCQAVHSAHQKGIIHRDLKPSNVLVTMHYSEPMPKVIDFGVAKAINQKLTEKTLFTRYASMIGTPAYMSPEQAEMSNVDVDTRSDIYSLGVVLYELLTGTTPISADRLRSVGQGEMQRIIAEEAPERPSTRVSTVHQRGKTPSGGNSTRFPQISVGDIKGELDWITLKCLEKDRRRRYDSANELVADIRRYLVGEPVLAVAPSVTYQLQKFYRRHRVFVQTVVLVWLALIAGLATTTWQWRVAIKERQSAVAARSLADDMTREAQFAANRAKEKEEEATRARRQTAVALYDSNIARARLEIQNNNAGGASAILDRCPEGFRGWEWQLLKNQLQSNILTLEGHTSWVFAVSYSPDGRWVASSGGGDPDWRSRPGGASAGGEVILWDAETGQRKFTLHGHQHVIEGLAFSADSRTLATASTDHSVRLWDVNTGQFLKSLAHDSGCICVSYSPDGNLLAVGTRSGLIAVWTLRTGERRDITVHSAGVNALEFSADSSFLYSSAADDLHTSELNGWDVKNWQQREIHQQRLEGTGLGLRGNTLASSSVRAIEFYDTLTGELETRLDGHDSTIRGVVFNPTVPGQFASCSDDMTIRLWAGSTYADVRTLLGHTGAVRAIDYSPDGSRLVTGATDGTIRIWDVAKSVVDGDVPLTFYGDSVLESIAFTPDSNRIRVARRFGEVVTIDATDFTTTSESKYSVIGGWGDLETVGWYGGEPVALDPSARFVAGWSPDDTSTIHCQEIGSKTMKASLKHDHKVDHITCSREARRIATSTNRANETQDAFLYVWDRKTGERLLERQFAGRMIARLALSDDGDQVAVATQARALKSSSDVDDATVQAGPDSLIEVFDVASNQKVSEFDSIQDQCWALSFDSSGKNLAAAGTERSVVIWNLADERYLQSNQGLAGALDVSWSPAGDRLAIVSKHFTKVLDTATAEELLVLQTLRQKHADFQAVHPRVCWSHDGRSLAVSSRSLSIWSIPGEEESTRSRQSITRAAVRRAAARRLADVHKLVHGSRFDRQLGRRSLPLITEDELYSPWQYRTRASIFEKVGDAAKADRDRESAELLEVKIQNEDH